MHVNSLEWVKSFLEHPTTEIPRANSSQVTSQEIIHPQTMHYFLGPLFDPHLILPWYGKWVIGRFEIAPKCPLCPKVSHGSFWASLKELFFTQSEEIWLRHMLKWNPNVHRIIKLKTYNSFNFVQFLDLLRTAQKIIVPTAPDALKAIGTNVSN